MVRLRARNRTTQGMSKWETYVIPAMWHKRPYGGESSHFHGNFCFSDGECVWDEVEVLEWVGFSGRGKV